MNILTTAQEQSLSSSESFHGGYCMTRVAESASARSIVPVAMISIGKVAQQPSVEVLVTEAKRDRWRSRPRLTTCRRSIQSDIVER